LRRRRDDARGALRVRVRRFRAVVGLPAVREPLRGAAGIGVSVGVGVGVGIGIVGVEDRDLLVIRPGRFLGGGGGRTAESLCGVGEALRVGVGGQGDPASRLLLPIRLLEQIGIGHPQTDLPSPLDLVAQRRDLEGAQCGADVAGVRIGARDHDHQLDRRAHAEGVRVVGGGDVQRPFGPAQAALAVGDHRQHIGATGDPQRGAQFTRGGAEVACTVGEHAVGLAHGTDPSAQPRGEARVRERGLVVGVLEHVRGDHVAGDPLCGLPAQAEQLRAHVPVQLAAGDAVRDAGLDGTVRASLLTGAVLPTVVPARTVPAIRASTARRVDIARRAVTTRWTLVATWPVVAARAVLTPRTSIATGRSSPVRSLITAGTVRAAVAGPTVSAVPGTIPARLSLPPRALLAATTPFRPVVGPSTAAVRPALVAPTPLGLVARAATAVAGAASLTRCPCVVVMPLPAPALVAVAAVALAAAVLSHLGPSVSSFVSLYAVVPRDTKRPPAADPLVGRRSVTAFTSRLIGRAGRTGDAGDIWS